MDCPACGGPVSLEVGPKRPPFSPLSDAVLAAAEDECIDVTRHCWECGWHEERHLRLESIETTPGDEDTVERAALREEIVEELSRIDSLATLEGVYAEVRRQRRGDQASTDRDQDIME